MFLALSLQGSACHSSFRLNNYTICLRPVWQVLFQTETNVRVQLCCTKTLMNIIIKTVWVCVVDHTSDTLVLAWGLRGAWWLRADRQARMRWMAPISRAMRRRSTPSSVVRGVLLNNARRTWNGSVGRTLADGDCRIWPKRIPNQTAELGDWDHFV